MKKKENLQENTERVITLSDLALNIATDWTGDLEVKNEKATQALFSLPSNDIPPIIENGEVNESVKLRKGFIDCTTNPYNGMPIGTLNGNIPSFYEYAKAYLPNGQYQPVNDCGIVHDATMTVLRNNIVAYFTNYATNAISNMVDFANTQLLMELKRSKNTAKFLDSYNRRGYYCDDNPRLFDKNIILTYVDGISAFDATTRRKYSGGTRVIGDLVNFYTYLMVDLDVILTTLLCALSNNFNEFHLALNTAELSDETYTEVMDAFNKHQILLITALENVVCLLYSEAGKLSMIGSSDATNTNITPSDMIQLAHSVRAYVNVNNSTYNCSDEDDD